MKNPLQDQRIVGAGAVGALGFAILFANASSTAAPVYDVPRALANRTATAAPISIKTNPFVAFAIPHNQLVTPAQLPVYQPSGPRSPFVPGPGARIVDAPAGTRAFDPRAAAPAPAALVVLCDTWTARAGSSQTPTAVFSVSGNSVIASAGDLVGGYRLVRVENGVVKFEGGEMLALGDCQGNDVAGTGTAATDGSDEDVLSAPRAGAAPVAPSGTVLPNTGVAPGQAPLPRTGAVAAPAARPTDAATSPPYGGSLGTSSYGNTIYGAPAPSSPPFPITLPNVRR
jgi:hypothetical protein